MDDLLPCPFCGGEQDDHDNSGDPAYFVKISNGKVAWSCSACNAIGPDGGDTTEAVAAWNRRATPTRASGA